MTTISKKLKRWTLAINLLQIVALILFEIVLYGLISYKDFIVLQYVPERLLIMMQIVLILAIIIPFVIKWGRRRTILSLVLSSVIVVCLLAASIFCKVYDKQLKNIFTKADETIDRVVENSKLSTDEYGVYVLKDDSAQTLADASKYSFGYNATHSIEDANTVISSIQEELKKEIKIVQINDPAKMAESLLSGDVQAVLINKTMLQLIENAGDDSNDDTNNGMYSDFSEKIRCIYTVNIKKELADIKDNGGVTKRCFNIYISGIDTEGDVTAKSRSDVNIIMSINPITHQILLISTPRDYYVPLSISNGIKDKLTHAGNYGIDVSMETLEMLYNIEIDYFVRMNFTGFEQIIDALGGIDVESDFTFSTHGYSYVEGLNKNLSGIEALWFARERKSFAQGDKQRGSNQMKVIEAVIEKCQSSAMLRNYDDILDKISESFQTNMTKESIKELVKFQLNGSIDWSIKQYGVSGTGQSQYTYSIPSQRAYVMEPDEEDIKLVKKLFNNNKYNKKIKIPKNK